MKALAEKFMEAGFADQENETWAQAVELLQSVGGDLPRAQARLKEKLAYAMAAQYLAVVAAEMNAGHKPAADVRHVTEGHVSLGVRTSNENRNDAVLKPTERHADTGRVVPISLQKPEPGALGPLGAGPMEADGTQQINLVVKRDDHGKFLPLEDGAASTPNKPRSLADIQLANSVIKPSNRFGGHKLIDGRFLGNLSYEEAEDVVKSDWRTAAAHRYQAKLLTALLKMRKAPTVKKTLLSDLFTDRQFEGAKKKAEEMSDAAA